MSIVGYLKISLACPVGKLHNYTIIYQIDSGIFPDEWKIATVTPIPKVSNATDPSDLRPISLLPVVGKLLEKYITSQIERYLFFYDNQNRFRKGKSTAKALSSFLDDTITSLNYNETCVAAYSDVRKAFDTINHNILIRKLKASRIGDRPCSLLKKYLSNSKLKSNLYNGLSDLLRHED